MCIHTCTHMYAYGYGSKPRRIISGFVGPIFRNTNWDEYLAHRGPSGHNRKAPRPSIRNICRCNRQNATCHLQAGESTSKADACNR